MITRRVFLRSNTHMEIGRSLISIEKGTVKMEINRTEEE